MRDDEYTERELWARLVAYLATLAALMFFAWSLHHAYPPEPDVSPSFTVEVVPVKWTEPYGGCDEAWQAPQSAGAWECRAHGWIVTARSSHLGGAR